MWKEDVPALSRKPAAESRPPSSQEGGDDEEDGDESPAEADEEAVDGSMASDPFAGLMESNLGDVDGNLDDLQPDEGADLVLHCPSQGTGVRSVASQQRGHSAASTDPTTSQQSERSRLPSYRVLGP
jgi:hypothetical protein